MTIFVTWQLIVTLDSIRNSCDVFNINIKAQCFAELKDFQSLKCSQPIDYHVQVRQGRHHGGGHRRHGRRRLPPGRQHHHPLSYISPYSFSYFPLFLDALASLLDHRPL